MSIIENIKRMPKVVTLFALILMTALMPVTSTFAWGGENLSQTGGSDKVCVRVNPTSTAENCDSYIETAAGYALFNRFIDRPLTDTGGNDSGETPTIDERNFVHICEINTITNDCAADYVDSIVIEPGKSYQVYIMYHNNGATEANGYPDMDYSSHNTLMNAIMPDVMSAGEQKDISSTISWDTPGQAGKRSAVWDEARIKSERTVDLRYISGSAKIHMNSMDTSYEPTGVVDAVLPTSLFDNDGTFIGNYNVNAQEIDLRGIVYGCAKYSGWVTLRFEVTPKVCDINPDLDADDPNCKSEPSLVPPASGIISTVTFGAVAVVTVLAAIATIFLLTGRNRSNNPKSTKK